MKITLKLYGGLEKYFPEKASNNQAVIEIDDSSDVEQVLNNFGVSPHLCRLVMVNGVHIMPEERTKKILAESDSLAVWPPSTG